MQNYPVTREWDGVDWLDPLLWKMFTKEEKIYVNVNNYSYIFATSCSLCISNFSKHRPSGPMLSISRNVRLCVCPSVCLLVCLFTFEVPFNSLFAPTSRSRTSNIFRDSESLGKSNGKKWSNIWTFLFGSGLKSPRNNKVFFCWFCFGAPSYGIGANIRIGREMLCLPYAGFF